MSASPRVCAGEVHGAEGAHASAMVEVPGGTTTVGLASDGSDGEPEQFGPSTTLQPFSIDRWEVTVRDYLACIKAKACPAVASKAKTCNVNRASSHLDHPMNCVDWGAAQAYCVWKGGRLPTSAEWERAARGDTNRRFPWGDEDPKDQLCWEDDKNGDDHTCKVGSHPAGANQLGIFDLAGNVAEWTSTRSSSVTGLSYIIRGGGFAIDRMALAEPESLDYRVRIESPFEASAGTMDLGFRCVKGGSSPVEKPEVRATVISVSPGSFDRKPILDGVRAGAKLTTQFKVDWLKEAGDFVYFEGTEHGAGAPAPAPTVRALLVRDPDGRWKTVELLVETAGQGDKVRDEFRARVDAAAARSKLPAGLFPVVEKSDRK